MHHDVVRIPVSYVHMMAFKTSIQSLASPFYHHPFVVVVVLLVDDYCRQHFDWVDRDCEDESMDPPALVVVVVLAMDDVSLVLPLLVVLTTFAPNTMRLHPLVS